MATDDKYDRQLRIWGGDGQKFLATSTIVALGLSSVSSETLKNLILPGIGKVVLVSDQKVELRMLGSNFYLTPESVGQDLAPELLKNLLEMNPDVKGEAIVADPRKFIETHTEVAKSAALILTDGFTFTEAVPVSKFAQQNSIRLVNLQQNGFVGYFRLYDPDFATFQSKPDKDTFDSRVTQTFPGLQKICDELDWENMDKATHMHQPYVLVLIEQLRIWRAAHDNKIPSNFKENNEFRDQIKANAKFSYVDEENFQEAHLHSRLAFQDPEEIAFEIEELFEEVENREAPYTHFWGMLKALKRFRTEQKRFPVTGVVPDMSGYTEIFLKIQAAYKEQAALDKVIMTEYMKEIPMQKELSDKTLEVFCKNWNTLVRIQYKPLHEEMSGPIENEFTYAGDEPLDCYQWYFVLRAVGAFRDKHSRYCRPGDEEEVQALAVAETKQAGLEDYVVSADKVAEVCRTEGAELVSIASVIGGVCSQEIIKLIVKQFQPIKHTWIFEGHRSIGRTLDL